jgi:hypothetical protein
VYPKARQSEGSTVVAEAGEVKDKSFDGGNETRQASSTPRLRALMADVAERIGL